MSWNSITSFTAISFSRKILLNGARYLFGKMEKSGFMAVGSTTTQPTANSDDGNENEVVSPPIRICSSQHTQAECGSVMTLSDFSFMEKETLGSLEWGTA
jgi:hypothetical protein